MLFPFAVAGFLFGFVLAVKFEPLDKNLPSGESDGKHTLGNILPRVAKRVKK